MNKLITAIVIAFAFLAFSSPAYALSSFLVSEWISDGDQFCKYDNGTVLNVGFRVCPLRISA